MPIDTGSLYDSFKSVVNTFQGGFFRPQTDFIRAANNISNQLWNDETRKAEKSQESRDNLIELTVSQNIITQSQNSNYALVKPPKDYGRFASAKLIVAGDACVPCKDVDDGKCEGKEFKSDKELAENYYDTVSEVAIELIDNIRWAACQQHQTKRPSLAAPKMNQMNNQFMVSPRSVSVVVLSYYVRPTDATFAYTVTPGNVQTGAGDQIVYDKGKSTPLQWPSTMINDFLWRLGEFYGLFTRDQFVSQISTQQKMTA